MVQKKDKAWVGRWFSSFNDLDGSDTEPESGYHRLDDDSSRPMRHVITSRRQGRTVDGDSATVESIYSGGYSTYQMSSPEHYDLHLKKKEKKPSVNTVWARIRYWLRYAWQMFKAGLLAAGPGVAMGPTMAPPPMAAIISESNRRRLAREGPVPDVYM